MNTKQIKHVSYFRLFGYITTIIASPHMTQKNYQCNIIPMFSYSRPKLDANKNVRCI